jgi:hypothetical protein
MFMLIAAELGVVGFLGVLSSFTMGGYIHILPVVAVAVLLFGFVRGSVRSRVFIAMMLIALGLAAFTYEGIRYATVEAAFGNAHPLPLALMAGAMALMAGLLLLAMEPHRASLGSTPDSSRLTALPTIESK